MHDASMHPRASRKRMAPVVRPFTVLLLILLACPAWAQDMRQVSTALAPRLEAASRKSVAVIDFTDLEGNVTELGRFLAEELSVALFSDAKTYSVVDRTHLKALLKEQKLATTGVIDPQTARQLGKIAGVDTIVTGSLTVLGDTIRVAVKALDTESARMIGATTSDVAKTGAIASLSNILSPSGQVSTPAAQQPRTASRQSGSPSPSTAGFSNDVIAVSARSVGVSRRGNDRTAVVTLTIENISGEDQYLAYATNSAALSDAQAHKWLISALSGLPMTYSNPPSRQELSRLPVGGRQTVILTFSAYEPQDGPLPTAVGVSMLCWRLKDSTAERMSVGLPEIPVAK